MILIFLVSMALSCLCNPAMVPDYSASPDIHPIMKEFSTAANNAHQFLVKQASKSIVSSIMKTTLTMVIQARRALDCGSDPAISSSSHHLGNSDHEAILEATRFCIGSEDLCLTKKLGYHVNISSLGPVCSALREVERSISLALGVTTATATARLGVTTTTVKPLINLNLNTGGTPHFKRKHGSAPPAEDGSRVGAKATQILSVVSGSVRFVGGDPDYETPASDEPKVVILTASVQEWTWVEIKEKGKPDIKRWNKAAGQDRRAGIELGGTWRTTGDFVNFTWRNY